MEKRYFSVADVNRMIPDLERTFRRMLQLHAQVRTIYRRLDTRGWAPSEDDFALDPPGADEQTIGDLASLKALLSALREDVASLQERGCLVKQIEHGLVDWYARKDGRDVLLCWKLGEKQVNFWHELEAGFAGRRPLEEL